MICEPASLTPAHAEFRAREAMGVSSSPMDCGGRLLLGGGIVGAIGAVGWYLVAGIPTIPDDATFLG